MNHVSYATAAERYAQARPYIYPQIVSMIKTSLNLDANVAVALDVACGTGQSTFALLAIADAVTGTDLSDAMLSQAETETPITFRQATAEFQPFDDHSFDLITVGMAYHWFDQPAFLKEAKRLLQRTGTLAIYNCAFSGVMENDASFSDSISAYYNRFPIPPHGAKHPILEQAHATGFFGSMQPFNFWVNWSLTQLVDYLCTQSAVIGQVEQGERTIEQVRDELSQQFVRHFRQPVESFQFTGNLSIWRLVK